MTSIPIQNIYYMLCYAWNKLEEKDLVQKEPINRTKLVDLFAQVLINGIYYLRKRGMDRGYIDYSEDTCRLKGKINFSNSLKRNLFQSARAYCEFDNLNYDVLHNQILKSTIQRLIKIQDLDRDLRYDLADIVRWFDDVETVPLTASLFHRVQLNRNNAFYGFLLNVCELIFNNLLVSEDTGETVFRDFSRDDRAMNQLFEKFVLNFYKKEQEEFAVNATKIKWYYEILESASVLPEMRTDVTLTSPDKMIIMDTKFYANPLEVHGFGTVEHVKSSHLFQIYAYVKMSEHIAELGRNCAGIMLYPTIDKSFDFKYDIEGHLIRFCTINLDQDWRGIHNDLLKIIDVQSN